MSSPLVTVICLCYNHSRFVREAIESVLNQTYTAIQLVVVDDASTDNSAEIIKEIAAKNPSIEFVPLKSNLGNCAAFNRGLALARGEFVIDFSTDDILHPERIEKQVNKFKTLDNSYGVVFTDAVYINENGKFIRNHYEYLFSKKLIRFVPEGNIFSNVISTYFIASPTMMIRKSILDVLNGYDEKLSYEDFDFWVRSSHICLYAFLDEKLTYIRKTDSSMSKGWYKIGDRQAHSTYLICNKLVTMVRTAEEKSSLLARIRYELRQCTFSHNRKEALLFFDLLRQLNEAQMADKFTLAVLRSGIPVSWLRTLYHRYRFS